MRFTLNEWTEIYSAITKRAKDMHKNMMDCTESSDMREVYRKRYCLLNGIIQKLEQEEL